MTPPESDTDRTEIDSDTFGRALLAANAANPDDLVVRLRSQLLRLPSAIDLGMHLIDYRLASLRPIEPFRTPGLVRPEPVGDSPLGLAYRLQRPTQRSAPAGHLLHVPISVRGQRLGVLTGTFTDAPALAEHRMLAALALAAGYSLLEAGSGTDLYEVNRRHGRLSVAAEMQWQLLPARAYQTTHFYVAGHLEPALRVAGDTFDFVINDAVFNLAVIDATGTGGAPSLVTTLAVTALRNARRSGLPVHEQAALASDLIWQRSRGGEHAAALLMQLDAHTGRATVVDAGSPAVFRLRDGHLAQQHLEPQTPLGMFDGTQYREEEIDLRAGDRAFILSDGTFTEGRSPEHLMGQLSSQEPGPAHAPPEMIRRLVAALTDNNPEPEDDITVVCVDWA